MSHTQRIYLDRVDGKWRIKGYEEHHFSTEEDAEAACDFAEQYFQEMPADLDEDLVETGPTPQTEERVQL